MVSRKSRFASGHSLVKIGPAKNYLLVFDLGQSFDKTEPSDNLWGRMGHRTVNWQDWLLGQSIGNIGPSGSHSAKLDPRTFSESFGKTGPSDNLLGKLDPRTVIRKDWTFGESFGKSGPSNSHLASLKFRTVIRQDWNLDQSFSFGSSALSNVAIGSSQVPL